MPFYNKHDLCFKEIGSLFTSDTHTLVLHHLPTIQCYLQAIKWKLLPAVSSMLTAFTMFLTEYMLILAT
jgi:hypothetical protein